MTENMTFTPGHDYLLVRIVDKVITVDRAQEILARIGEECSGLKCKKVLLDELTVEERLVPPSEIKMLAHDFNKNNIDRIYMAFLCQPHLVGYDSHLLSLYTYNAEFIIRHFTDKQQAEAWLASRNGG